MSSKQEKLDAVHASVLNRPDGDIGKQFLVEYLAKQGRTVFVPMSSVKNEPQSEPTDELELVGGGLFGR